ncbi:MAG: nitroreductase family protein [Clostridia bacterium]|nr:nitroreductase family protein [Clostridia bacterium]
MEVLQAITGRRSVRKFKNEPVPDEHLRIMLDAAMHCPSACNRRPYEFYVIKNEAVKEKISAISPNWRMLKNAGAVIVVCGRLDLEEGMHSFWQQDCSAATQNILLAAYSLGYGACWCGCHPVTEREEGVSEALDLMESTVPLSVIAVGVADEAPAEKGFYDETRVTFI